MRCLPVEDLGEVREATVILKNGKTARVAMHLIEGSKEEIEETFSKTFDYSSISKTIESSNNTTAILKEFRKPSEKQLGKQWILFQILFQYRSKFELTRNHNKNQLDLQQFTAFTSQYLKSHNLAVDYINGDMLEQFFRCIGIEVSPITSVFGGMMS